MKRSEINNAIELALEIVEGNSIHLPPFAHWTPDRWRSSGSEFDRIKLNGLGWDVTDFGGGDFDSFGAVLLTLRNGNYEHPELGTPYAEKLIILKPGQRLPLHLHFRKTEDIINRVGGVMVMELYNSLDSGEVDMSGSVRVVCDGMEREVNPGELLEFHPGESITLTPKLYHRFWAGKDRGMLVCGEVSSVNDDQDDNRFAEPVSRFADIEEDEPASYLLCNDY